ncbi:uncharacterized protein [Ptychodera flava]|uniref:uncharacterized protein isoform X2 n=1 Tax=Ptychodera flava TaxID=63121 RepID=UPI003969D995
MVRVTVLVLVVPLLVTAFQGAFGFFDGLGSQPDATFSGLQDKPLLRAMILRQLTNNLRGSTGVPGPVIRALGSARVHLPVMRAMLSRYNAQQNDDTLGNLVLFRLLGEQMGKKIIEGALAMKEDSRVYNFGTYFNCDCALEYLGENAAMLGFMPDLLHAVCEEAGKKCTYQYATHSECLSHKRGERTAAGVGLLGRNLDVCLSWFKTPERQLSVSYTDPYWILDNSAQFYVRRGNPGNFDPEKIEGKAIGFVDGIASDFPCLLRGINITAVDAERLGIKGHYVGVEELYTLMKNGQLDAAFVLPVSFGDVVFSHEFDRLGKSFKCSKGGELHGITRKDNLVPWFNDALRKMKEDGRYYGLCRDAEKKHGHKGSIECM